MGDVREQSPRAEHSFMGEENMQSSNKILINSLWSCQVLSMQIIPITES